MQPPAPLAGDEAARLCDLVAELTNMDAECKALQNELIEDGFDDIDWNQPEDVAEVYQRIFADSLPEQPDMWTDP